jgi:hypothetical protein
MLEKIASTDSVEFDIPSQLLRLTVANPAGRDDWLIIRDAVKLKIEEVLHCFG